MPFTKYMNDPTLFNAKVFNFKDYLPALVDLISYKGHVYSFIQEASAMLTSSTARTCWPSTGV